MDILKRKVSLLAQALCTHVLVKDFRIIVKKINKMHSTCTLCYIVSLELIT